MELGIREDFSSNVTLDTQLKAVPSSGLYLNSGVHPSINVGNLLAFLPKLNFTISAWDSGTTYGVFTATRDKKDLVTKNSKTYQSIKAGINQDPESETEYWLETNIESLRLKALIESVKDRVYNDLNLTRRLVNNEYLYEVSDQTHTLPNDYAGWVFEPKGSDYVSIRINEIALQKSGTTPVDVYVINQGTLVTTLSVTPTNGTLSFADLGYTLDGKGRFIIAIDSTEVISNQGVIDPLKYEGFVVYTVTGTGASPQAATYSETTTGNGLAFNISSYFDGTKYIENNIQDFGKFIQAVFELICFQHFLHNPNNVSNREQRIQMNDDLLLGELKNTQMDSVISRYYRELKRAKSQIEKSFDSAFDTNDEITLTVGSI